MSEDRIAAVFSIGNSTGGCEYALREIAAKEALKPHLYYFYGRAAPGQPDSPLSTVHKLKTNPEFADFPVADEVPVHSFSIDQAYAEAVQLMHQINAQGFRRVYVGPTGGTNLMAAALFHAAMTELTGEVIPVYTQGKPTQPGQQQSIAFVTGVQTQETLRVRNVLRLCQMGQLAAAGGIAGELPKQGRGGFVRSAVLALAAWDNFEYKPAGEAVGELAKRFKGLPLDVALEPLLQTVERYSHVVHHIYDIDEVVRDQKAFAKKIAERSWPHQVETRAIWIPFDWLANGQRRLKENRPTEAVMRAYRAVETAIHCRLFAFGVHPSALQWDALPLSSIAEQWTSRGHELEPVVAFDRGLELLGLLTGESFADLELERKKLQHARNYCYLEHGYLRSDPKPAERLLTLAGDLVKRILWPSASEVDAGLLDMRF